MLLLTFYSLSGFLNTEKDRKKQPFKKNDCTDYTAYESGSVVVAYSTYITTKELMKVKLKTSILKVLASFDIFDYPVSKEEIYLFLDRTIDGDDLRTGLMQLVIEGHIFKFNEFYTLKNDQELLKKRIKENANAQYLLLTAHRISKFLFRFPYIKGIGISGSLSKNVANEQSDIDYFIITKSNRLWIARTIMHIFKKFTFLTGHQHWYCMNYYVDEDGMQIEEKNIFTATELVTLLPVCGNGTMQRFFKVNDWAKVYFPNYPLQPSNQPNKSFRTGMKKMIEFLLNNKFGDWLDNYLMKLTTSRWKAKEKNKKLNIKGNRMGLKTDKHYCKPNPVYFQEKILLLYNNRLNEWEKKWNEKIEQEQSIFFS